MFQTFTNDKSCTFYFPSDILTILQRALIKRRVSEHHGENLEIHKGLGKVVCNRCRRGLSMIQVTRFFNTEQYLMRSQFYSIQMFEWKLNESKCFLRQFFRRRMNFRQIYVCVNRKISPITVRIIRGNDSRFHI